MMAERLREAWNGEIVQSARIVLRDGDAGTFDSGSGPNRWETSR